MVFSETLKRPVALAGVALLILASFVPLMLHTTVNAYGLPTSREIRLSSSVNGATDVTYSVSFATGTTSNVGGLVIDFCSNSPIIGESCTAPTGFDINEAGLALANQVGITDFAIDAATDTNTLVLARTAANVNSAVTISLELGAGGGSDGVTNPTTTNTTFYARILTYAVTADAQAYVTGPTLGSPVDAAGAAMSTTAQITVTSKVQERLTFCVYTSAANYTDCTAVSGTAINLGDTNGVLSDAGPFVDINAKYNVSTNASNGVTIRAKGATLTSGGNTISNIGASAAASAFGTEQFGFCTYRDSGGGTTGLTAAAPYDNASCSAATQTAGTGSTGGDGSASFAFDTSTGGSNLTTTYGDTIATKAAGNQSTGRLAFIGNIATTTEPGIYTSTMTFIATGNY